MRFVDELVNELRKDLLLLLSEFGLLWLSIQHVDALLSVVVHAIVIVRASLVA